MSEAADNGIRRNVTRISGDSARPLLLPGKIANNASNLTTPKQSAGQKRLLPISDSKLSFDPKRLQLQKPKKLQKLGIADSHEIVKQRATEILPISSITYDGFLHFDQAGPAIIGSANTKDCRLVAIKTSKPNDKVDMQSLTGCVNDNIVQLLDVFQNDGKICMVYEQMKVTLRLINGNPYIKWKAYEIAAISKEVCFKIRPSVDNFLIIKRYSMSSHSYNRSFISITEALIVVIFFFIDPETSKLVCRRTMTIIEDAKDCSKHRTVYVRRTYTYEPLGP